MQPRIIEVPPLCLRADVHVADEATRTVDLVFSTGAEVVRMDWWSGKKYREVLSMKPEHVRLERMNNGAPLLDAHSGWSVGDILGVVEEGSARIEKGAGTARVRFSQRAQVAPIYQDVRDKIIRNVSVGYRVHKFVEEQGKTDEMPTRTAIDWEPYEVSLVPMPADAGAKVRSGDDKGTLNPCVILTCGDQEPAMNEQNPQSETIVARDPLDPGAPLAGSGAPPAAEPNERDLGVAAERTRCQGIYLACRVGRLPVAFADTLIADNVPLVDAQTRVFQELMKRGNQDAGPRPGPSGGPVVGEDPLVHVRAGIANALLHRVASDRFKLEEIGRPYRGMSILDIGKAFLNARGTRTTNMGRSELIEAMLSRSGMHSVSDFPNLFEDVANKNLRAAYEAAPQTWLPLSRAVNIQDFKPSRQLQVGDAPELLEILEHGEFTQGTIGESKEAIQLKTYGRMFAITRQALINDDLNAFGDVPAAFGRKARDKESDLAWAQITSNPNMGDGVALFHAATHGNLAGAGAAIDVTTLGAARAALRSQKGIDGVTKLNLSVRYLIVPAAKETVADQFVTVITPAQASNANPFQSQGRTPLTVICEPRLDAASATAWYVATSVDQAPVLYYGTLDGQTGPTVNQMEGFDVDGMKFRCRIDVAFKAADWRAIYKNPGA